MDELETPPREETPETEPAEAIAVELAVSAEEPPADGAPAEPESTTVTEPVEVAPAEPPIPVDEPAAEGAADEPAGEVAEAEQPAEGAEAAPAAEGVVAEPGAEGTVDEPVAEVAPAELSAEGTVAEAVVEAAVDEPAVEGSVVEPVAEGAPAEPPSPPPAVSVEEFLSENAAAETESGTLTLVPVPVEDVQLKAVLEAVIYLAEEPLTIAQIAAALSQPVERVRSMLEQLVAEFEKPEHGVSIREVAGGFKMATKPEHHETVRNFVKSLKPPLKLSLPALETLAVIAYKQPVTSPEIMEIRGVQGAGVLKTLLDRKLIAVAGRKNVIGKPMLYKTTKEFLIQFGLKDLSELPSLKEFEEIRRLAFSDLDLPAAPPAAPEAEAPRASGNTESEAPAAPEAAAESDDPVPPIDPMPDPVPGPPIDPAPEPSPVVPPEEPGDPAETEQ